MSQQIAAQWKSEILEIDLPDTFLRTSSSGGNENQHSEK